MANTPLPFSVRVLEELVLYLQYCLALQGHAPSAASAIVQFREGQLAWPDCLAVGKCVRELREEKALIQYMEICQAMCFAWSREGSLALVRLLSVQPSLVRLHIFIC